MSSYRTSHCTVVRLGSATSKVITHWERRPLLGTVQYFGSCCCEAVSCLYVQWTTSPNSRCSSGPYRNSKARQACCRASKARAHQARSAARRTGCPAGLRMGAGLTGVTRTGCPAGLRMGARLTDMNATERADLSIMNRGTHTYIPTYLHTYIPTYIRTVIHKYIHVCIHTYMHTYCPFVCCEKLQGWRSKFDCWLILILLSPR